MFQIVDGADAQGFACDNGEIAEDLVRIADGRVAAAISVSQLVGRSRHLPPETLVPRLTAAARAIEAAAFGTGIDLAPGH